MTFSGYIMSNCFLASRFGMRGFDRLSNHYVKGNRPKHPSMLLAAENVGQ